MGIRAVGAMRRAKLMIGGHILALAVQFTLARDAAAQLATDQPRLQMEQLTIAIGKQRAKEDCVDISPPRSALGH
jgi:hypothetical protein